MSDGEFGTSVPRVPPHCPGQLSQGCPKCPGLVLGTVVPRVSQGVPLQHPGHGHTLKGVCAHVPDGDVGGWCIGRVATWFKSVHFVLSLEA